MKLQCLRNWLLASGLLITTLAVGQDLTLARQSTSPRNDNTSVSPKDLDVRGKVRDENNQVLPLSLIHI